MTIWPNHTWPTLKISLTFPHHHHSECFQWLHSTFPNSAGQILLAGKPGIERSKDRSDYPSNTGIHQNQESKAQPGNHLTLIKSPPGLIFFHCQEVGGLSNPTCRKCLFKSTWIFLQFSFPSPGARLAGKQPGSCRRCQAGKWGSQGQE